jgi:hypothetical protein
MTTEYPTRKYATANEELRKARDDTQKLRDIIARVGQNLLRPYEFMVSDISVSGGFPPEIALAKGIPSLSAREWPTAQQIAEAVANLHQKYKQVQDAYHALSDAEKGVVNPPPDKK